MLGFNKIIDKRLFLETIGNDRSLLETVIALFEQQSESTLNGISLALIQSDRLAFERWVHDLKNIGRSIACQ